MNYDEIVERFRFPRHKGVLEGGLSAIASNSPCGDKISVHLKIENGKVVDAMYSGTGCVLSNASAEVLCEHIVGMKVDELYNITYDNLVAFLGFLPSPSRAGCVETPLNALRNILIHKRNV